MTTNDTSSDNRLLQAAKDGDVDEIARALNDGANAKGQYSHALSLAARHRHAACVKLLLPVSDPVANNSLALRWAAQAGDAECVKLLLPFSDPMANNSLALRCAAHNGHAECIGLLIPVCDPKAERSNALCCAAHNGHTESVVLLLPVSDPKVKSSNGLDAATTARAAGHPALAALIDAFVEARELAASVKSPQRARPALSL